MNAEWDDQPAAPAGEVPGKTLAAQREAMGWTVEQVAEQLKLAVRQVVALEAGDYAALPGPAVVRGFVRAYAKVLKLDAAPLVAMIPLDTPEPGDATATTVRRDKPAAFSEVRFPTGGKRSGLPLGPIALVLVVAAAGAWQFGLVPAGLLHGAAPSAAGPAAAGSQASVTLLPTPVPGAASTPAGEPIETTLIKPGEELTPTPSTSVPLISVPPPAGAAPTPGSGSPAGVAPAAPAPAAAASAGANALVLEVREDSWIEVRRAKGAPLIARLVKGGSTETFDVTEPLTLVVGKPSAVSATLRGAAVELPPVTGSTVSRVNLK
jgi:cytoskeleton protein RodZ